MWMKICYISYVKYGAGSWIHTSQFVTALKDIHHDVIVFTPLANQDANSENEKTTSGKFAYIMNNYREVRLLLVMFLRRVIGEFRLLKTTKPDVVILRNGRYLSAIPLCHLLKIPIISEINGPTLEDSFYPKGQRIRGQRFWQWMEKKMMELSDHNMVVSETLKHYYITCGAPPAKITSVPNGVDIHTFDPRISGDRIKKKFGLTGKIIIGFSGNFAPWHGLNFLADTINIIAKSNNYKTLVLLLIGTPGSIMAMPEFPNDITIITGHIPHVEMPEYLAAIDIFVAPYPKITPFYFSPLKIFEAMSMGKPVIASDQGQICELITDRVNGLLYPPEDQSEFVRKIELLVNNVELRNKLGQNARKTIEKNFTWKDNAQRMLDICRQVIGSEKLR